MPQTEIRIRLPRLLTGFRAQLLFLFFLALLPLLGLSFYGHRVQQTHAIGMIQDNVLRLADTMLAEQGRTVKGVRQLLKVLAVLPSIRDGDVSQCSTTLAGILEQSSPYLNLGVINSDGVLLCSALPVQGQISLADRGYFQEALLNRRFSVGQYQIGRITKKASINFGYPIADENGTVRRVAFAALDLTNLNNIAKDFSLPPGSVVTLMDTQGIILARSPEQAGAVGKSLRDEPVIQTILARDRGAIEGIGKDGTPKLYAFSPLKAPGCSCQIRLVIESPSRLVFAEANHNFRRNLFVFALVTCLGLLAAWLLGNRLMLKPIRDLIAAKRRVASGDLSVRIGDSHQGGEFGELATAFDEMADSLEKEKRKRDRAEKELREAHGQLVRSEKLAAMGTLTAGITHEILNPVNILSVQIQQLQMGSGIQDPEKLKKSLDSMRTQTDRIARISRNMLEFAREQTPETKPLDIRNTLDGVTNLVEYQFRGANIKIVRDYAEDLPDIQGDEDQLRQVILNLVTNAKQAMPNGGEITLRAREMERDGSRHVVVAVEDTGTGIPENILNRIFDPFFTTKGEGNGTGLGLSISHGIVENHGGTLDVKSIEGLGSTFVMDFPALSEEEVVLNG